MVPLNRKQRSGEQGSVMLWVLGGFLVMVAFVAVGLDTGAIYVARTQLASASDAGALAAMQVVREGGTRDEAELAAKTVAEANRVMGGGLTLDPSDIVWGDWDYATRTFTPNGTFMAPAVQLTARRTAASASGAVPLALAGVIGSSEADVEATSVASAGCRELVLVQDVTKSFMEEIDEAREALHGVVDLMADHALPGDKLGLVIFAAERRTLVPLSPMPQDAALMHIAIDSIVDCLTGQVSEIFPGLHPDSCNGTDQAMGINEARQVFEDAGASQCGAERLVVVVSDGVPCLTFRRGGHPPGGTQQGVWDAADAAEADGLSITPVMLFDPFASASQCSLPGMGALEFNNSMARGFGVPLNTPDEEDLDELLRSVLSQIPVHLVQ